MSGSAAAASSTDSRKKPRIGERVEVTIKGQKVILDKRELKKKNRDSIRVGLSAQCLSVAWLNFRTIDRVQTF